MTCKRYEIYLANLDPIRGSEIQKTRPVVIVSPDGMNEALETVVICPLTTKLHPRWRTRIQVVCAGTKAEVALDQIRTISKQRLLRKMDRLKEPKAAEIRQGLGELYGG